MKGYKVIRKDMTHNGFKYQRGLNIDTKPFNPIGSCVEGGLYFFTDLKDLPEWLEYGDYVWEVQVPEGAQCVQDPDGNKYRADKLVLVKRHKLASTNIWKQIIKHVDKYAIYWAASSGHVEVVKELIAYKAPVDANALYVAACNGHLEIVTELIGYKAPVHEYALYWAARKGHLEVVKALMAYQAPVDEDAICVAATEEIKEVLKEYMKQ